ncbi:hypothetical protein KFL_002300120 [Klebsormidium nitens]|uniref:Uncharacterized protein n=1 Tax=Klebsormidium nitens TaxID=105231 RepID=A0A1Y1I335_KLENI|nr:hypothetical protein KFL_002300120 [Klebsormidium nitens]|eukprot:GAQ85340.1 hypothetical protein KFL_002300120 [Klebsormidium nitens]
MLALLITETAFITFDCIPMEGYPQERLWRCLPVRPAPEHEAVAVFGSLIACVSQAKGSVRRNNGEALAISDAFEEEQLRRLRQLRKQLHTLCTRDADAAVATARYAGRLSPATLQEVLIVLDLLMDYPLSDFIRQMASAEAAKAPRSPRLTRTPAQPRKPRDLKRNPNPGPKPGPQSATAASPRLVIDTILEGDENASLLRVELPVLSRNRSDLHNSGSPNVPPSGSSPAGGTKMSKSASVRRAQLDVRSFKLSLKQREEEFTPEPWEDVYENGTEEPEFNGLDWDLGEGMEGVREENPTQTRGRGRGRKAHTGKVLGAGAMGWNRGSSRMSHVAFPEGRRESERRSRASGSLRESRVSESTPYRRSEEEDTSRLSDSQKQAKTVDSGSGKAVPAEIGHVSQEKRLDLLRPIGEEEERPESSPRQALNGVNRRLIPDGTEAEPLGRNESGVEHLEGRPGSRDAEERIATAMLLADLLGRRSNFCEPALIRGSRSGSTRGSRPASTNPGKKIDVVPPVLKRVLSAHVLRTLTTDLATVETNHTRSGSLGARRVPGAVHLPKLVKKTTRKLVSPRLTAKRPGTALAASLPATTELGVASKRRPATALELRRRTASEDSVPAFMHSVRKSLGGDSQDAAAHAAFVEGLERGLGGDILGGLEQTGHRLTDETTSLTNESPTASEGAVPFLPASGDSPEPPLETVPENGRPKVLVPPLDLRAHMARHVASPRSRSARAQTTRRESRLRHCIVRRSRSFSELKSNSRADVYIHVSPQTREAGKVADQSQPRSPGRAPAPSIPSSARGRAPKPLLTRAHSSLARPSGDPASPRPQPPRRHHSFSHVETRKTPKPLASPRGPHTTRADWRLRDHNGLVNSHPLNLNPALNPSSNPPSSPGLSPRAANADRGKKEPPADVSRPPPASAHPTPRGVADARSSETSTSRTPRQKEGVYKRSLSNNVQKVMKPVQPQKRPTSHVPRSSRPVRGPPSARDLRRNTSMGFRPPAPSNSSSPSPPACAFDAKHSAAPSPLPRPLPETFEPEAASAPPTGRWTPSESDAASCVDLDATRGPDPAKSYALACDVIRVPQSFAVLRQLGLVRMELAHCGLSRRGLEAFLRAVPACPQLRALNLAGNQIDGTGCKLLSEGLREHAPGLQDLDLSSNRVSLAGVQALTSPSVTTGSVLARLQTLSLRANSLPDTATCLLVTSLQNGCQMQGLDLADNGAAGRTAAALAVLLGVNSTLRTLDLSWNHLPGNTAAVLAEALAGNKTLDVLKVAHNSMGAAGDVAMKELLDRRRRTSLPADQAPRHDEAKEIVESGKPLSGGTAQEPAVAS